jgi:hypothetical protein
MDATISSYKETFNELRQRISIVRPNRNMTDVLLLHDNARPHTACAHVMQSQKWDGLLDWRTYNATLLNFQASYFLFCRCMAVCLRWATVLPRERQTARDLFRSDKAWRQKIPCGTQFEIFWHRLQSRNWRAMVLNPYCLQQERCVCTGCLSVLFWSRKCQYQTDWIFWNVHRIHGH